MKFSSHLLMLLFTSFLLTPIACKNTASKSDNKVEDSNQKWNGKSCAIALTYDDGLHVHLDNVLPALNKHDIKGTFYVHTDSDSFKNRKSEWTVVAEQGHELGNHTVFHPCAGQSKDRDWVNPKNDLDNYSVSGILDEIKKASGELNAIDGKTERTYAYTCGDTSVLDSSYVFGIEEIFVSARGVNRAFNTKDSLDRFLLDAHSMNGHSAEHMKNLVDQAIENEYLLVFLFHGVGGEHDLNVDKEAHDQLVNYINQKKNDIWATSLVEIMNFIESE